MFFQQSAAEVKVTSIQGLDINVSKSNSQVLLCVVLVKSPRMFGFKVSPSLDQANKLYTTTSPQHTTEEQEESLKVIY